MRPLHLLLALAVALPGALSASADAQQGVVAQQGTRAQRGTQTRIAIVVDGPWERNDEMRLMLEHAIREVLGKDAPVVFSPSTFYVGSWTLASVHAINERLLADPAIDMVLGMGLIASQDLATRGPLPKPCIAPIIVDIARQRVPLKDGASGTRNLSYLTYPQTFERDLKLFQEIVPIHKLVNISSKPYDDVLPPPRMTLPELGTRLGLEVTELFLGFEASDVLTKLPADADAVFIEPTLHLPPAEFTKLVQGLIARRLPSFCFLGENEVREGVMATANPDILPRLSRRIAMNVQRVLSGEEPGTLPVAFTPGKHLSINLSTAYAVGVSPRWDILLEAELVRFDTTAAGAQTITLPQAIRYFAEQNLDVQAKIKEVAAAARAVDIARAPLLPQLDVSATGVQIDKDRARAGGMPERTASVEGSATQLILSEPVLANLSIQSSLQEGREAELEATRLNTILEGSQLFLNYLRAKKIFYLLMDNVRLTRTNLELARVRQTTGAAGPEEPLRWEVEIANLRKAAMTVQAQMNQALYALKQVLNMPLLYQLNVADVSLADSSLLISDKEMLTYLEEPVSFELLYDFLASEASRRSPELRQIDAGVAAQERGLTSLRLSYFLPTIAAFGKFGYTFSKSAIVSPFQLPAASSIPAPSTPGEAFLYQTLGSFASIRPKDATWSVGLQVSLNLFNGLATRMSEDQAALRVEQVRLQRRAAADKVALRIRVEMERAKASYFSLEQTGIEQDAARKALAIVTEAYSRGATPILSLLDAQNASLRADQVAANALYDFLIDYFALQRAVGEYDVLMSPADRSDLLQRLSAQMARVKKR